MIPLIYNFIVASQIRRITSRLKFWLVYTLALLECILVIAQFGVIPYESQGNRYMQITQQVLQYVTYFIMIWILLWDTVRIVGTVAMNVWFGITLACTVLLIGLLIWEYTNATKNFYCHSDVWVLIRINMIVTALCLVVVGIFVSFKFQEVLATLKEPFYSNARKTNIKIWVILSPGVYGAITGGLMDIYAHGVDPDVCYELFKNPTSNAIFWFVHRIIAVNAWIWPILYTFNARDPVKFQDLDPKQMEHRGKSNLNDHL